VLLPTVMPEELLLGEGRGRGRGRGRGTGVTGWMGTVDDDDDP